MALDQLTATKLRWMFLPVMGLYLLMAILLFIFNTPLNIALGIVFAIGIIFFGFAWWKNQKKISIGFPIVSLVLLLCTIGAIIGNIIKYSSDIVGIIISFIALAPCVAGMFVGGLYWKRSPAV
eukprot:TRINITY_DN9309_c0_g1_i1.p1 TRINITY_DN9309_c0_g1~~TRINITY_DN9309_c0_g1_i1.p1  ORF type:complete len:123 (+),score=29.76 TRINITY_DN9309_c0_g1_i1:118-486(+)